MIMQHSVMIETSFIMDNETEIRKNRGINHVFYDLFQNNQCLLGSYSSMYNKYQQYHEIVEQLLSKY